MPHIATFGDRPIDCSSILWTVSVTTHSFNMAIKKPRQLRTGRPFQHAVDLNLSSRDDANLLQDTYGCPCDYKINRGIANISRQVVPTVLNGFHDAVIRESSGKQIIGLCRNNKGSDGGGKCSGGVGDRSKRIVTAR